MHDGVLDRARTWVAYHAISALVHQPRLLRLVARAMQRQPWVGYAAKAVATRADIAAVFDRPLAFSSTSNQPNLVAGEFLIGLESGPRHAAERALLQSHMPSAAAFGQFAAEESRLRCAALRDEPGKSFDLIADYLVPVVWRAMSGSFGAKLPALEPGDPMCLHLRHIGAHLIVGKVAPQAVQQRARESAAALNGWVRAQIAHCMRSGRGRLRSVRRTSRAPWWAGCGSAIRPPSKAARCWCRSFLRGAARPGCAN